MGNNIFQQSVTPVKPKALAEERIFVYTPLATVDDAGIASFDTNNFIVNAGKVYIKENDPLEQPTIVQLDDDDFLYGTDKIVKINWPFAHNASGSERADGYGLIKIAEDSAGYLKYTTDGLLEVDSTKLQSTISSSVAAHNVSTTAHTDIRALITGLTTRVSTNEDNIAILESDVESLEDTTTTHTSQITALQNAGYITKFVNDLVNYYKKTETYNKTEVDNLIAGVTGITFEIVEELPTVGDTHKIYLLRKTTTESGNVYDEYIYVNNTWELIGTTAIDLSNYLSKTNATAYTPTGDYNPATKKYVDDTITDKSGQLPVYTSTGVIDSELSPTGDVLAFTITGDINPNTRAVFKLTAPSNISTLSDYPVWLKYNNQEIKLVTPDSIGRTAIYSTSVEELKQVLHDTTTWYLNGFIEASGSGYIVRVQMDDQTSLKSYVNAQDVAYIGREQLIGFTVTSLANDVATATLDSSLSDFTFTNSTGYLFDIQVPSSYTVTDETELVLKDNSNNEIVINCIFVQDKDETVTFGNLKQVTTSSSAGLKIEFNGHYSKFTDSGTTYRVVYTDTIVNQDTIQLATMPTASADYSGKIVQYIGTTTSTYTNGYFYKCGQTNVNIPATVTITTSGTAGLGTVTGDADTFADKVDNWQDTYEFVYNGQVETIKVGASGEEDFTLTRSRNEDENNMYAWVDASDNTYFTTSQTPDDSSLFFNVAENDDNYASSLWFVETLTYSTTYGKWQRDFGDNDYTDENLTEYGITYNGIAMLGARITVVFTPEVQNVSSWVWQQTDVQPAGSNTLNGLSDVISSSLVNADVLRWDSAQNKWKPTQLPDVDQTYSASSINAQSGVAVAQAVASVGIPIRNLGGN